MMVLYAPKLANSLIPITGHSSVGSANDFNRLDTETLRVAGPYGTDPANALLDPSSAPRLPELERDICEKLGQTPFPGGGAAAVRFVREAGWGDAMRCMLTGEAWHADEAYRMGLVQKLTAPSRQLDLATEFAKQIAFLWRVAIHHFSSETEELFAQRVLVFLLRGLHFVANFVLPKMSALPFVHFSNRVVD